MISPASSPKFKNLLIVLAGFAWNDAVLADTDWFSVTLDNDYFVGNDNGYSNGLFFSWYDTSEDEGLQSPSSWLAPLRWSLPEEVPDGTVRSITIGQTMITPDDITVEVPPANSLPYTGLLFFNSTFLSITESHADKLSTTLGIVGPHSGAESTQKWWHELIGADEPRGWDTQLDDELVFQFSRGRIWRAWVAESENADLLLTADFSLGTLSSSTDAGVTLRFGRDLVSSYATTLFTGARTSNPTAAYGGWYTYIALGVGYTFNQIYTDGNTFHDSRSIDYEKRRVALSAGAAYSWGSFSIALTLADANVLEDDDELGDLTRYGSITLAWGFD